MVSPAREITAFIDGEAGTTGLQLAERLDAHPNVRRVSIDSTLRKDPAARADLANQCDVTFLCLPDDAAREAIANITSPDTVVIDASTAHRVADGWTYGFPELSADQRTRVASSRRIANPGCYPTGFLALVAPLVSAELVPADWPVTVNAVSGYSGGGRTLIQEVEGLGEGQPGWAHSHQIYGLSQTHKHLPEMQHYSGLNRPPVFMPAVGKFRQGMIVEVGLALDKLPRSPDLKAVHEVLHARYAVEEYVSVIPLEVCADVTALQPEALNNTNRLEVFVFGNDREVRLVARLDNLGKGASGAAVQSMNIALGLEETAGL